MEGSVTFDEDEVERINRIQIALLLHITPEQVDEMSIQDQEDVLAISQANTRIRTEHWKPS